MPKKWSEEWKYILGNKGISIARSRENHLYELFDRDSSLKVASRDIDTNEWTKWKPLPQFNATILSYGYDIHRSMLKNEIVIESDYEDYAKNVEATKYISKLIQSKGYTPHIYYSGSKSLHVHVFLDYTCLDKLYFDVKQDIMQKFDSFDKFKEEYITWMREQLITCFGLEIYAFDKALIKSSHLIRAEMSRNKRGFKTFLGYNFLDIPNEPIICNLETKEYPNIATYSVPISANEYSVKESFASDFEDNIKDFLQYYDKILRERNMSSKIKPHSTEYSPFLRPSIKLMLDTDKFKMEDGKKRGLFILANELKQVYPPEQCMDILHNWNVKLGSPFNENDLKIRVYGKNVYKLTTNYINTFVKELGYSQELINKYIDL
jgi:hypothetical protein